MSRLPIKIKEKALNLRSRGYSIKEISKNLNIAKSTSSLWLRDVKLNKDAQKRLKKRRIFGYYKRSLSWQKKRLKEEKEYKSLALKTIKKIKINTDYAKLYCSLLYWCEGGKGWKEGVRFVNSDPILIKIFLLFLRKSFRLDEKKFHVLMHLHDYHNEKKQKNFWSDLTKISENQFYKTSHKSNTKKRIKKDYPGCVAIHYNNLKIAREIRALYKVFSKRMGAW